jgi:dsDNA-binding SOS-regulon protein
MRKVGMTNVQPTIEYDIELFEFAEILWSEKVILGCFLAVALVVGCLSISINKKTYETVIGFEIITFPPTKSNAGVVADLHKEFHSKDIFSQWAETMPNAKLQLEDVLPTVLINDVVFASDIDEEALVLILTDKILIRSNETGLILDTMNYARFVGDVLSQRYSKKVQDEYDRLLALSDRLYERRDRGSLPATFNGLPALERLTVLESYLSPASDGAKLLDLRLPSKPVATNVSNRVLLPLSVTIGGVFGVVFVFIRHGYRQRKSNRARLVS